MPRKKKQQVVPDVTSEMTTVIQHFMPCEWVIQFDNDEPVVFTEADETNPLKEVVITISNHSESRIMFTDNKTGKKFRIYSRQKQS
jgi:hypothetical protein